MELSRRQFDHEKLNVYKYSLEFSGFVAGVLHSLDGNRHLKDQLSRASLSIPLNIAEGNGKRTHADRRKYFDIARGSAMECAATLDVLVVYGLSSPEGIKKGKEQLISIVSMLTRLMESGDPIVREDGPDYGQVDDIQKN